MDFHAVFETLQGGRWTVHDANGLAPRPSLVRIATGRDAADAAFSAVNVGVAELESLEVSATVGSVLPRDDAFGALRARLKPEAGSRYEGTGPMAFLHGHVQIRRQRTLLGEGQVGSEVLHVRSADDRARQARVAEGEPQDELEAAHVPEQVLHARCLPAALPFALGQPEWSLAASPCRPPGHRGPRHPGSTCRHPARPRR